MIDIWQLLKEVWEAGKRKGKQLKEKKKRG
jgi:hypothetical protein